MTVVTFSLVSHTNAGKTTLARTLLGTDIGEVRDAPHVTEFAAMYPLVKAPGVDGKEGDELRLWDTPGFGDSARLVRRLRERGNPLGWFLTEVWDRWTDRAFWASQRALQHVQADSDVLLYLVNAAESPAAAGYVEAEMQLLEWVGKPVLVLLNQLGAPRAAAEEAADVQTWRSHLARWPLVREVLPLDAFARCWVHELTLMRAAQRALAAAGRFDAAQAMPRLTAAWQAERENTYADAMRVVAESLARTACAREAVAAAAGWSERLRRLTAALGQAVSSANEALDEKNPEAAAQARLAQALDAEVRNSTAQLLALHKIKGGAQGEILSRVASQFDMKQRVPEGRAAMLGGAVTGAIAGLKADIVSGGLTMGGGLLAGALLGALGAAGVARGINVVRGTGQSWVAWSEEALNGAAQAAVLRYLAVAHFGRGRGDWTQGEAPAHWQAVVTQALAEQQAALSAAWSARSTRFDVADDPAAFAVLLLPPLQAATRAALHRLYGDADAA
jgi:hypothetical protein